MLYKNSGTLKRLKPIQDYYNLNSSKFVDYKFIKKSEWVNNYIATRQKERNSKLNNT